MTRGLWEGHQPTLRQTHLVFRNGEPPTTQADLLLYVSRRARKPGRALALPEIMRVGIAPHGARFDELRARGSVIENEITHRKRGVLSRYVLAHDPEQDGAR